MKFSVVCVGNKMPAWVSQGYDEYEKRLPKELRPKLIELPLATRSKSTSVEKIKEQEGRQICATLSKTARVIVLDVLGKPLSTELLAKKLEQWQMQGDDINIVIGGPDGLSQECKARAQEKWSLSGCTLPHPLVRVVLIEQLYRAWTITQNHPYHK